METKNLCNEETRDGFYPTPEELAEKMLSLVDLNAVKTVLEPSAGKGDLALAAMKALNRTYDGERGWQIDLVEKDPSLRAILSRLFTEDGMKERFPGVFQEAEEARRGYCNWESMKKVRELGGTENVRIIHDDFLTCLPNFRYDLILMNPPFSEGAAHLLHALGLAGRTGGRVICLLNAETLRNPYTNERKRLVSLLEKHDAQVEYLDHAFSGAERETDVDVALVSVSMPREKRESCILEKLEKAEREQERAMDGPSDIVADDPIEAALAAYRAESEALMALLDEYGAVLDRFRFREGEQLLVLKTASGKEASRNSVMEALREKYWAALLDNKQFIGLLPSKMQTEYRSMVSDLRHCEFSRFNIGRIHAEMMASLKEGAEQSVMDLFEKLTVEHTYNRSINNGNVHYYNGWKTNQAYKVGKKVVIPSYGVFSSIREQFDAWQANGLLSDLEKAFNYLDGGMTREVDLHGTLRAYLEDGTNRNIPLKYFNVTFYKKGTAHITFRNMELVDRLNIFAGQKKGWLPPAYGKKSYDEMDTEEKAVVDSFQGKEAYEKVMENPERYLVSAERMLMLDMKAAEAC